MHTHACFPTVHRASRLASRPVASCGIGPPAGWLLSTWIMEDLARRGKAAHRALARSLQRQSVSPIVRQPLADTHEAVPIRPLEQVTSAHVVNEARPWQCWVCLMLPGCDREKGCASEHESVGCWHVPEHSVKHPQETSTSNGVGERPSRSRFSLAVVTEHRVSVARIDRISLGPTCELHR